MCRILKPHACISAQCTMHTGIYILNTKHAPPLCPAAVMAVSHPLRIAGQLCGMLPLSLAASPQRSSTPPTPCSAAFSPSRRTVVSDRQPLLVRSAVPPLPIDAHIFNAASGITNLPRFARATFSGSPHSTTKITPTAPFARAPPAHSHHKQLISRLHAHFYNSQRHAPRLEPTCAVTLRGALMQQAHIIGREACEISRRKYGLGYFAASADPRRVTAASHGNIAASQHSIAASSLMTAASSIFITAWSPLLMQTKYTGPSRSLNYVSKFVLMPHHRRRISIIAVPLHWLGIL
ncbi:hypothetical protein B0H13DRAFT_2542404 [Mycena leptocephala]|nr:hypothetical protein B0H13DRAFT_2542404 [Mycena leptocephala]